MDCCDFREITEPIKWYTPTWYRKEIEPDKFYQVAPNGVSVKLVECDKKDTDD